jgi:DNA-binding SARP family transcriptional activator
MRFGVLGPVTVQHDSQDHNREHGRRAAVRPAGIPGVVLAVLLLRANQAVSRERLAQAVWGEDAPVAVAAGLRNHVLRLRRQLGPEAGARVRTTAGGYLVEVHPGELDEQVFLDECRRGRQALRAGAADEAVRILSRALDLWHGEPFANLPDDPDAEAQVRRLHEVRLLALEGRVEAGLQLGRHSELIAELQSLTTAHPLREVLHGQLMLALYRSGRQAEALEAFGALRRTLVGELGLEPAPEVRGLHRRILTADPGLTPPAPAPQAGPDRPPVPDGIGPRSQLPSDTRAFTGREQELEGVLALAREVATGRGSGALEMCAIDGMGGIGKTALAVHAAHLLRTHFPDGQLFVDLRGHTSGIDPLTAADALDWLLRSLGTPPQLIPEDPDERAALYRDRLADTRTLIVLDNAASTAQVRPLLPASSGCLVLVTSRRRLTGLDDAHNLALDVLSQADAVELLHAVAGPDRIPPGHPAAEELIQLCGRMPLAIRITAARLRHHPTQRLEDAVDRLRDEHARLDYLQDEDRDLTAIFESSYRTLPSAEQRLFGLLGLIPGPDLDAYAAAALTDTTHRIAERLIESLLDHNLLTMHTPGRYRLHDLLRLYARDLDTSPHDQQTARTRLFDYYQQAAEAADRRLSRYTRPGGRPTVTAPAGTIPPMPDYTAALAWTRSERDNLIAAMTYAADRGQYARVIALHAAMGGLLRMEWSRALVVSLQRTAIAAARRNGDRLAEANAVHGLGRLDLITGKRSLASASLNQALDLYRELGNRFGEANTLHDLARSNHMAGSFAISTALQKQALALYRELGDVLGEANTLHDLGRTHLLTGDISTATAALERSLKLFRDVGHVEGQAIALWTLGRLRCATGDYPGAADLLEQALTISVTTGNSLCRANTIGDLGRVRYAIGDYAAATTLQEQALAAQRDLGSRPNAAYCLWDLGRIRHATGDHAVAAELLQQALAVFREVGMRQGEANVLHSLGRARQALGGIEEAAELYRQALAIFRQLGDRQGETETLNSTGALAAEAKDPATGLDLHRRALRLAREISSPLDEAHALRGIARCLALTGGHADADALTTLDQAVAIYRRIGAAEAASWPDRSPAT